MKTALAMLLLLSALLLVTAPPAPAADPPLSREAVEQIVQDYLKAHPEVIVEALQGMQQRQREAQRQQAQQALAAHREQLLRDASSPVGGNTRGDVTVVEFFDYACPHCKTVGASVRQLLREDPKIRLVYKELPVLGEASVTAARGARAANAQGKSQPFHEALMAAPGALSEAGVFEAAAKVGLDVARLKTDMAKPEVTATIESNYKLAQALGITGTPAFVIGDGLAPGAIPLARLKDMVARARQARR